MGATAAAEPAHNLPLPLTSLVGRTRELGAIADTLHRTRLVTIAGPGGGGKTRVALDVARRQLAARADGVWLVDLAAGPGAPDVVVETARVLEVRGPGGTTAVSELQRSLAHRELLIVLDNCEHVVEQCAELAAASSIASGSRSSREQSRSMLASASESGMYCGSR
jgi:predicted ATPase